MSLNVKNNQKGAVAILLVLLIMFVLLLVAVGISRIGSSNLKISNQAEESMQAYQVADSGLEYALDVKRQESSGDPTFQTVAPGTKIFCSGQTIPPPSNGIECNLGNDCQIVDGNNQYCVILTDNSGNFPATNAGIETIRVVGKVGNVRRSVGVSQ